jgi:signal transduction histidine kinase
MSGKVVLGVLSIAVDQGHDFDESELEFLATVADVLAGIIQRKRAERLQREHERVALSRERMARIGEVSAGVAHTIRNPLHGVLNCVEILATQAPKLEPELGEVLSLMRDGLERIEKVTRRLLALTREAEPELHPTELGDLLSDVVDLMAVQARSKQVKLEVQPEFVGEVLLDADRVVEGLTSVVSNAIDACEPGGVVTVRSELQQGPPPTLVLAVQDTGCGIPEEHLSRVLDPFFTTKPIGEGSGLGLAITRRVMDEHGGDIEIRSTVGAGTTVRLLFPVAAGLEPASIRSARPAPR